MKTRVKAKWINWSNDNSVDDTLSEYLKNKQYAKILNDFSEIYSIEINL